MVEKNFLEKILFESNSPPQPSLSDQWTQAMANIPKKPTMSDILNKAMNPQPKKDVFERIDQNKEIDKSKNPPRNPKYVVNNKNFVKLVDAADAHESKIEMVCCKAMDLEDAQASMQKEMVRMNTILKKHENDLSLKASVSSQSSDKPPTLSDRFFSFFSKDIDWKSFAGGALALAAILAFIYKNF
jgi:hypothetical protein